MSILTLSFNEPETDTGGYRVSYRPKGSTQPYYIVNSTIVPINISTNIITNVDYEGYIQGICDGKLSKGKPFTTAKYNNATGSVNVLSCDDNFSGSVSSISFDGSTLLPLNTPFPLTKNTSGDFISNKTGSKDLVLTHSFSNCHIKITDSAETIKEIDNNTGTVVFTSVNISAVKPFGIEISCNPSPI